MVSTVKILLLIFLHGGMCCPQKCRCYADSDGFYTVCNDLNFTLVPSGIPVETELISLKYNLLSSLPTTAFRDLLVLRSINLNQNIIQYIQNGLFNGLQTLEALYASENNITYIEESAFTGLSKIKKIYLQRNHIKQLASGLFANLSSLQELNVAYNDISNIAIDILLGSTNIKFLNLASNDLEELQFGLFKGLSELGELYLSFNVIRKIDNGSFIDLSKLRQLYLHRNPIEKIPDLEGLLSLLIIKIYNTQITEIPDGIFTKTPSLQELYIQKNKISVIERNAFDGLTSLKILDLSGNELTYIHAGIFADSDNLQSLKLYENPFHCDCRTVSVKNWMEYRLITPVDIQCANYQDQNLISIENVLGCGTRGHYCSLQGLEAMNIFVIKALPIQSLIECGMFCYMQEGCNGIRISSEEMLECQLFILSNITYMYIRDCGYKDEYIFGPCTELELYK